MAVPAEGIVSDRALIMLSRAIAAATVATGIASVVIAQRSGIGGLGSADTLQELAGTLIVPAVVLIAIPRVPRNGSVWAFAIVGFALGLVALGDTTAEAVGGISSEAVNAGLVAAAPADVPTLAAVGVMMALTLWIFSAVFMAFFVLLLFPDGNYPEPRRRWRRLGVAAAVTVALGVLSGSILYWPTSTTSYAEISSARSVVAIAHGITGLAFVLLTITAIIGYALKWKRSEGESRIQYRWVGFAFLAFAVWQLVSILIPGALDSVARDIVSWALIIFIPVAYTVAILRYRLYGIDVVISRTLTYAVLAGFITGVYALLVVVVGSAIGAGDEQNLALSIVAVAVVAITFEPLRNRVQRAANRLVYGERATPYDVLAQATRRLADTTSAEATLTQIADLLVAGTGAAEAVIWMRTGDRLRPQSAHPPDVLDALHVIEVTSDASPQIPGDLSVPVLHRGELLGAVSITKSRGQSVTKADERVLADVAAGASLLLRNIVLNAELAARADQLRASRRRLVTAHDTERHRLERDLHDGAQQQVVALKVKLGIARTLAGREGVDRVVEIVESLAADTQVAVDEMRAVAHGIYPPLLESEGLAAALAALSRSAAVPLSVDAAGVGRHDRGLEEAIYFCVLEAVARAVDAGAKHTSVLLADTDDGVGFAVRSDSPIGEMDMVVDRVDAMGGTVEVTVEGGSTVVAGQLPIESKNSTGMELQVDEPVVVKATAGARP